MKKETEKTADPSLIEVTPIRLTSDETRAVCRLYREGKPVERSGWSNEYKTLVGLGVAAEVPMPHDAKAEGSAWMALKSAVIAKDLERCQLEIATLKKITASKDDTGYMLTTFGKEIAAGVAVRLGRR